MYILMNSRAGWLPLKVEPGMEHLVDYTKGDGAEMIGPFETEQSAHAALMDAQQIFTPLIEEQKKRIKRDQHFLRQMQKHQIELMRGSTDG